MLQGKNMTRALTFSLLLSCLLFFCSCDKKSAYDNVQIPDIVTEERPFRMLKVNLLWEKAKKVTQFLECVRSDHTDADCRCKTLLRLALLIIINMLTDYGDMPLFTNRKQIELKLRLVRGRVRFRLIRVWVRLGLFRF